MATKSLKELLAQIVTRLSNYPKKIYVGTYVYSGASAQTITITDTNMPSAGGLFFASCQDAGVPVNKCTRLSATSFKVELAISVTLTRINYMIVFV